MGKHQLSQTIEVTKEASISAIVIEKAGDFPPFWQKDTSFIKVMEEFYQRVKTKTQGYYRSCRRRFIQRTRHHRFGKLHYRIYTDSRHYRDTSLN